MLQNLPWTASLSLLGGGSRGQKSTEGLSTNLVSTQISRIAAQVLRLNRICHISVRIGGGGNQSATHERLSLACQSPPKGACGYYLGEGNAEQHELKSHYSIGKAAKKPHITLVICIVEGAVTPFILGQCSF